MKYFVIFLTMLMLGISEGNASSESTLIETLTTTEDFSISLRKDHDNRKFIKVDGVFTQTFGQALADAINSDADIEYVELNSKGGMLREITIPGRIILEKKIPVVVSRGDVCVSACALLAIYSNDIKIDGQLAFHMPFTPFFNRDQTLFDIQQSMSNNLIVLTREMFMTKWKLILLYVISTQADRNKLIVFEDGEKLEAFRFNNPEEFISPVNVDNPFKIKTTAEIENDMMKQKMLSTNTSETTSVR